tara:strand:+ start:3704 stop:4042 length:339 start_codon:yes stop_codon:yes gene_type:complete
MAYGKSSDSSGSSEGHRLGSLLDTSPIDMSKPATDGALGGVISALAGKGSFASKGATLGGLIGPMGSVVGGGLGLVADIFGGMSDAQEEKDKKAQESMNQLRSSLQDWYTLE